MDTSSVLEIFSSFIWKLARGRAAGSHYFISQDTATIEAACLGSAQLALTSSWTEASSILFVCGCFIQLI